MLSNILRLNFWYLKVIYILYPKIIGYILENKEMNKCVYINEIIPLIMMKTKIKMKKYQATPKQYLKLNS